jgi:hypothetical protein
MVVESSAPSVYATSPEQQSPRTGACAAVSYSYLIEDLFVCFSEVCNSEPAPVLGKNNYSASFLGFWQEIPDGRVCESGIK